MTSPASRASWRGFSLLHAEQSASRARSRIGRNRRGKRGLPAKGRAAKGPQCGGKVLRESVEGRGRPGQPPREMSPAPQDEPKCHATHVNEMITGEMITGLRPRTTRRAHV